MLALTTIFVLVQLGCAMRSMGAAPDPDSVSGSPNYDGGGRTFVNSIPTSTGFDGLGQFHQVAMRYRENDQSPNGLIPVTTPASDILASTPPEGVRVTWVGHSTMLIEIDGFRVLTDPIWSDRCSPFPNIGPKRFHPPAIAFEDLPPIDAVIISHDHYDHLDHETIARLAWRRTPLFVPLGVGGHLAKWGIERFEELDWWDERTITRDGKTLTLAATPARHFSGRGLADRNKTLWASWVVKTDNRAVYFGGDTGYFPGFVDIGQKYGPFDATLMPIGAYDPAWSEIHLNPEEAVQAHVDLGGTGVFFPTHFATFSLAAHGWGEPMERMLTALEVHGVQRFALGAPGQMVDTDNHNPADHAYWWRPLAR